MGCATPLMILDGKVTPMPVRHAAIGWKDTAEARRALHDLVALLEPGCRVSVVSVGSSEAENLKATESIKEVVRHLARHGLNAQEYQIVGEGQTAAQALQGFAALHGAELLAIGAFAHSRLREIAFGGVTHSMIERAPLPLLLSR